MRITPLRRQDVDMTQGNITRHILMFALPLVLRNLFQQMYNLVDTYVVGQYATNEAYAAVGSVGVIVNIFIGLFSGFATGAGVVISQHFGAHDPEKVTKTVHTAAMTTLILCPIFTALGLGLTPILGWIAGTLCGALAGSVLPVSVRAALGVMLYGMFIAIVVPQARQEKPILFSVALALVFSCLFAWVPGLKEISSGLAIVICTVAAAAICAVIAPVPDKEGAE